MQTQTQSAPTRVRSRTPLWILAVLAAFATLPWLLPAGSSYPPPNNAPDWIVGP